MVSSPLPVPNLFFQPRPCCSMGAASGSGPTYLLRIGGAVGLAERVSAGNERNRLLVIHRHAGEGLADVARRSEGIGIAVGPFGIDVNQSHLNRGERILEITIAGVALVGQPLALGSPVNVFVRAPKRLRDRRRNQRS